MVTHIARVWINRVRLPILLVVKPTGTRKTRGDSPDRIQIVWKYNVARDITLQGKTLRVQCPVRLGTAGLNFLYVYETNAPLHVIDPRHQGTETCLVLEGEFTVTPEDDREPVTVGPGDLCVFPDGMRCTWDVRAPVKKHFQFE